MENNNVITVNKNNDLKYRKGLMSEDQYNETITENKNNSSEEKIELFTE